MYGKDMFDGLAGCLVVMALLAAVGLVAIGWAVWWLFTNVSISFGA